MKRKYKDLRKVAVDQGNYYATGCLLSDPYFKENYQIITVNCTNNKMLVVIQEQYKRLVLLQMRYAMILY